MGSERRDGALTVAGPKGEGSRQSSAASGGGATRGIAWSLAGYLLPIMVGLYTIPLLVQSLGAERFGLLAMVWMVVGYFSLFDLGLGRALTQRLSAHLASSGCDEGADRLVWTAILVMVSLGAVAMLLLLIATPAIEGWVGVEHPLWIEAGATLPWVAAVIPAVSATSGLRGALEGHRSFFLVNLLRLFTGLVNFVAPLVALLSEQPLVDAIVALVCGRIVLALLHATILFHTQRGLLRRVAWSPALLPDLLSFGGWVTVSNMVSPLMAYLDRFVIGGLVGLSAVAYYVTPYEVLMRVLVVPAAVTSVLLPLMSASLAGNRQQAALQFRSGMVSISLALLLPLQLVAVHAGPLLSWWLDPEFAAAGSPVVEWLTLGLWFNSIAQMPYTLLHSAGRADQTARLHLAELAIYLPLIWYAVSSWGIVGAAAIWTIRVAFDLLAMCWLGGRQLPLAAGYWRTPLLLAAVAIIGWPVALSADGALTRTLPVLATFALAVMLSMPQLKELVNHYRAQ